MRYNILLCVVVALFYFTTLINAVNGNCPQGITFKDKLYITYYIYVISSIDYHLIDCPLPRSCKDWCNLGIRKNCYYPIYPDGNTQQLLTTVYNPTNNIYSNLL